MSTEELGTPKKSKKKRKKLKAAKQETAVVETKAAEAVEEKPVKKSKKKLKAKAFKQKSKLVKDTGRRKAKVVATGPTGMPRVRDYKLPTPRQVDKEKMDKQLKRLRERKLVSKKVTSLVGVSFTKSYHDRKYKVIGTKKGWVVSNKKLGQKGPFAQLYGVACEITAGPRDPYRFFKDELSALR